MSVWGTASPAAWRTVPSARAASRERASAPPAAPVATWSETITGLPVSRASSRTQYADGAEGAGAIVSSSGGRGDVARGVEGDGRGLLERLADGPVVCAEGYLFELERRGYVQAGPYVPEVVLEHPEAVAELHREFVHAGSDVVEAFTYYAHREKLRIVGREGDLEPINRQALELAKGVAAESGALLAGDICNTNVYLPDDEASTREVRALFEEQAGWAVEAGVDFVIGETFSWLAEGELALDVIKAAGLPAVITLAIHREPATREGLS